MASGVGRSLEEDGRRVAGVLRRGRVGLILGAVVWLLPTAARACAVCGTGPGIAGDPTARGFYWGILFLMALPFTIAGSVGGWLVYRYWRARGLTWRKVWVGPLAWTHKENGQ